MSSDDTFAPKLEGGESVVWAGRPDPLGYGWYKGRFRALYGLIMTLFAVSIVNMLLTLSSGPSLSRIDDSLWWNRLSMGSLAVFISVLALAMLLSPVWYAFEARRTRYTLTNRRAVISVASPFGRRQSFPLSALPFVELKHIGPDRGHILFANAAAIGRYAAAKDGFLAVPDAGTIEPLLRRQPEGTR